MVYQGRRNCAFIKKNLKQDFFGFPVLYEQSIRITK